VKEEKDGEKSKKGDTTKSSTSKKKDKNDEGGGGGEYYDSDGDRMEENDDFDFYDDDLENDKSDDDAYAWPPEDFNPLAPRSLPIGPNTSTREKLSQLSIVAQPGDESGIAEEERHIYLLQLPSDLRIKRRGVAPITDALDDEASLYGASENSQSSKKDKPKLGPGRLGKLQLTQSGKVYLVTTDGLRYSVSNGMATCFAQYLASVTVDTSPEAVAAAAAAATLNSPPPLSKKKSGFGGAGGGGGGGGGKGKKQGYHREVEESLEDAEANLKPSGELYFLDGISRKFVITPEFDIGQKRVLMPNTAIDLLSDTPVAM
jgi:hypothetical protein